MTIAELLTCRIIPFELSDDRVKKLFSFFLHSAPSIESKTAMKLTPDNLDYNWQLFLNENILAPHIIYSERYSDLYNACEKNNLGVNTQISRKTNGFVCIRKGQETDCECILRHLRNSIAHNNVCYCNLGNRKFLLFEDYNRNNKMTARILLSQTILASLKKEISRKTVNIKKEKQNQ